MRTPFVGSLATAGAVAAALAMAASASAASSSVTKLAATKAPAATSTPSVAAVAGATKMDFEVDLGLSDPSGAAAFARSVSSPTSSGYRQYLTPAQWEARFSPSHAAVSQVKSFLKAEGLRVTGVSADRMAVSASGTAAQVEHAFVTQLSYHSVVGRDLILNDTDLSVPTPLASVITGVSGITQTIARPAATTGTAAATKAKPGAQPPAGFRNARPCSAYYGQLTATTFPPLAGYGSDLPYAPCGYTPPQMRGAYGLTGSDNGSGVTVAIIDAYASPTIYSDASTYATRNDPSNPLTPGQFSQIRAKTFNHKTICGGENGWWGEETLDVESVHAMAPGANILFAGAKNCLGGLNNMLRKIVDNHLAEVVTNSYGDTGGDLLDPAGNRTATDELLMMAAGTGVSVMYSTGDDGDNYDQIGAAAADYPASSPWATAIGGTSLQIGATNQQLGQYGWSTGIARFCNKDYKKAGGCTKSQLGTWSPVTYDYGGGGGTSVSYIQPYYQAGIVPTSLSEIHGSGSPMRVIPDVSMDADPTTGLLVGETQTFPNGVYYDEYRLGGTSLASPLFAGLVADSDQAAGGSAGFLDPAIYSLASNAGAIQDITPPASPQAILRPDYLNSVDATDGILYSARTLDQEGLPETYCTSATSCTQEITTLETSSGYDNMTGVGAPAAGFVGALAATH